LNKMTHDRRFLDDSHRCTLCGTNLIQGEGEGEGEGESGAPAETTPLTNLDSHSDREKLTSLREKALLIREEAVEERENDLHRCEELLALQQGRTFALRVQEISDAQIAKVTYDYRNSKLREANQHLVIASVQLQTLTEEMEKTNAAMPHLANHDFLTNLPNRLQQHDRITQTIAMAKRKNETLAVLFLDLDRFRAVNATLGYAIGDQLLQAVAHRIKRTLGSSDTVSRQGCDEFIIVLSEDSREKTFALTIEKIYAAVTATYAIASHDFFIGATIGISLFPQDGEDSETLMRNADDAMRYAKENGRNTCQYFGQEIRTYALKRQCIAPRLASNT
jgi:diguanylate cyclase (GGDEF)-like protein